MNTSHAADDERTEDGIGDGAHDHFNARGDLSLDEHAFEIQAGLCHATL